MLDVGCGPGRYALALAPRVREVVAVDPSKEMLKHLRRQSRGLGIDNIRPVQGSWQDVANPTVDVALCSSVLPIIDDAGKLRVPLRSVPAAVISWPGGGR